MNLTEQIREQEELLQEVYKQQNYHFDMLQEANRNIEAHRKEINRLTSITEEPMNDMINGLIK